MSGQKKKPKQLLTGQNKMIAAGIAALLLGVYLYRSRSSSDKSTPSGPNLAQVKKLPERAANQQSQAYLNQNYNRSRNSNSNNRSQNDQKEVAGDDLDDEPDDPPIQQSQAATEVEVEVEPAVAGDLPAQAPKSPSREAFVVIDEQPAGDPDNDSGSSTVVIDAVADAPTADAGADDSTQAEVEVEVEAEAEAEAGQPTTATVDVDDNAPVPEEAKDDDDEKELSEADQEIQQQIARFQQLANDLEAYPKYTYKNGTLEVTVISASNLDNMDTNEKNGCSDPFVQLDMKHNKQQKTKVIDNDLNPVWNESFRFGCRDALKDALRCTVYDKDKYTKNDMIGVVVISVVDVAAIAWPVKREYHIQGSKTGGKLLLSMRYYEQ